MPKLTAERPLATALVIRALKAVEVRYSFILMTSPQQKKNIGRI